MKKLQKLKILFLSLLFILTINTSYADQQNISASETYKAPSDLQMARLVFGGDVLPHINFHQHALNYGGGEYNYDKFFEKLAPYTSQADFVMLNCEFTVNPNAEPSGYPMFNSRPEIYRSLADIGVDVITTANNHCLDSGTDGIDSTIDAIESYGINNVGTYKDAKTYLIKEINGIKIGILAYAEHTNGMEYLLDTEEKRNKVNFIDSDIIRSDIAGIIKAGAEFVVVYPHWGVEYSSYPEAWQIDLARDMIDWGADMVIGNHPHVIQPREEYIAKDGRKGIIYYSLGNLISNQNYQFFDGDQRVNQGLLVDTIIYKGKKDKKAKILNASYQTIWTEALYDDYGWLNRSYVVSPYLKGDKYDEADAYMLEQMQIADDMCYDTMHTIIK